MECLKASIARVTEVKEAIEAREQIVTEVYVARLENLKRDEISHIEFVKELKEIAARFQ